jgi:hypothetical protein
LDQNKLGSFGQPLQSPTFNDVLTGDAANLSTNATRITLGTEDHFTYILTLGDPNADGEFPVKLSVNADLPEKRVPAKDEKPEDKANLDTEWENQQSELKTRLALHQTFSAEHWTFLVPGSTLSGLLKKRTELMGEKPPLGPVGPVPLLPIVPPSPPKQPEN